MIKLLIVDDEQLEREGMQAILERHFPHVGIRQAKNGNMAVELAKEYSPDLILMDIKMPGMNGLEAMEAIKAERPEIKFIMVTAYDTFTYMKAAIKLGAKDYVLKPSKASEIVHTIGKVLEEIEQEREQIVESRQEKEKWQKAQMLVETDVVTQLLFDHVHDVHVDMLMEMLEVPSSQEMFVMVLFLPEGVENQYSAIRKRVLKCGWTGALYGRQLPMIVFRKPGFTYRSQATTLARELLSLAKGSEWFIGIGKAYDSLDQVRHSYQEAMLSSVDTGLRQKYRFFEDIPLEPEKRKQAMMDQKHLMENIRLGKWDQVLTQFHTAFALLEKERTPLVYTQQRTLEVLWMISRTLSECGVETDTPLFPIQPMDYRQLREETERLIDGMKDSYVKRFNQMESDTFQQIKQFIQDHSHEDISLDTLAQKVNLSPIYISKMFKEKQGMNYIDFLTECRMEKAKVLMGDMEKSIKEITFEVGYHDPNYFSKVFKKVTRYSPKEYRKTLLGQHA
ncbi:response regulator [Rossellomorea sp. YZS02]|uniref:response regulator n=1 Tax=Rossellomorea sp. YZS02 TaxID=3097358 RepID=UPI002A11B7E0|nr:response regulator [Rossellomorea sp. YZS02]MDX8342679.1 response regulator [Rossellomorea sp. YZS02]